MYIIYDTEYDEMVTEVETRAEAVAICEKDRHLIFFLVDDYFEEF